MHAMASFIGLIPVVVLFLAALIVIPWDKSIITEPFVWDAAPTPSTADVNRPEFSRRTVHFSSQGLQLEGWVYTPKAGLLSTFAAMLLHLPILSIQVLHHQYYRS